jgi:hypothetical protein
MTLLQLSGGAGPFDHIVCRKSGHCDIFCGFACLFGRSEKDATAPKRPTVSSHSANVSSHITTVARLSVAEIFP